MDIQIKNYDRSYLYGKANYGSELYQYVIKSERINKSDEGFQNIQYLIKRNQITSCLSSLLNRESIVLMMPTKPMPRAFKVFAGKDIKEDKATKVFIDVSEIIKYNNGEYTIRNTDIDKFISYLACALCTMIYHSDPKLLLNNTVVVESSTYAFATLCSNIIEYLRIGSIDNIRAKMLYISALYYQNSILLKDITESVRTRALNISKLSKREADVIDAIVTEDSYENINIFVTAMAQMLRVSDLKLDNFIDKWILLYGSGTQFACEIFTAFANMLINAYVGAYINNQKQIEKIVGKYMINFTTTLFKIGGDLL